MGVGNGPVALLSDRFKPMSDQCRCPGRVALMHFSHLRVTAVGAVAGPHPVSRIGAPAPATGVLRPCTDDSACATVRDCVVPGKWAAVDGEAVGRRHWVVPGASGGRRSGVGAARPSLVRYAWLSIATKGQFSMYELNDQIIQTYASRYRMLH